MPRMTGEFRVELTLPDATVGCAEAIEGLGWSVETVEGHRLVSRVDVGSDEPGSRFEITLERSGQDATLIRVTAENASANKTQLSDQAQRLRQAIETTARSTSEESSQAPRSQPPPGWYENAGGQGSRWWDGSDWTNHVQGDSQTRARAIEASPAPAREAEPKRDKRRRGFPRPRWRKMTWVLIIWTALILVWMIAGAAGNECGQETTELNQDACEAGTGIGVAIVGLFGFVGFVFLSLIWFMTRPKGRDCPACGETVKKGRVRCDICGHDFAATAQGAAAGAPTAAPP